MHLPSRGIFCCCFADSWLQLAILTKIHLTKVDLPSRRTFLLRCRQLGYSGRDPGTHAASSSGTARSCQTQEPLPAADAAKAAAAAFDVPLPLQAHPGALLVSGALTSPRESCAAATSADSDVRHHFSFFGVSPSIVLFRSKKITSQDSHFADELQNRNITC